MKKFLMLLMIILFSTISVHGETDQVQVTGQNIWGDTKNKVTYIQGQVRMVQGKTVITTENATVNLDRKSVSLKNGVKLKQEEVLIESGQLEYDLRKKSGTFKEQVTFKRGKVTGKDPFQLMSKQLYLEVESKNFTASGEAFFEQEEFGGNADQIEYTDAHQELLFRGHSILHRLEKIDPTGQSKKEPFTLKSEQLTLKVDQRDFTAFGDAVFEHREFIGQADRLVYTDKSQELVFEDHVMLNRPSSLAYNQAKEPFRLTCNHLELNVNTKDFTATGDGVFEHREFTGTAEFLEYNDERQELIFKEHVLLNRPKKIIVNNQTKVPFKLSCTLLKLEINTKSFKASGETAFEHDDFKGTADRIDYDDQLQQMTLIGNSRLTRPQGEIIIGERIVIDLKTKGFTVFKGANLSFDVNEEPAPTPTPPLKRNHR